MKIAITSGKAEGPSKLNAFDNALLDAGIGDVNLIKVSSIIPKGSKFVELPKLEAGAMINCVLAHSTSDNKGDIISAAIAVATSEDFGCVVENSALNKDPEEVKEKAVFMVKEMMKIREMEINKIIVETQSHVVKDEGSVVAAVVYLE
ncbi:MAG: arginine decarboxylase, pyruvoyl-dependent [Methanobacterium sp.]|uniref:pyruvoyl-dependent arginine decarboxylase n=1 Tax=Methanobacterium sp. TaxID=2164 RepID=UPI003D648B86|nr:arginine decarboxylase, pyruvoyl-dependent [Methanobacterium sp.]